MGTEYGEGDVSWRLRELNESRKLYPGKYWLLSLFVLLSFIDRVAKVIGIEFQEIPDWLRFGLVLFWALFGPFWVWHEQRRRMIDENTAAKKRRAVISRRIRDPAKLGRIAYEMVSQKTIWKSLGTKLRPDFDSTYPPRWRSEIRGWLLLVNQAIKESSYEKRWFETTERFGIAAEDEVFKVAPEKDDLRFQQQYHALLSFYRQQVNLVTRLYEDCVQMDFDYYS